MKKTLFPYIAFFSVLVLVIAFVFASYNNKFPLKYEDEIIKYSKEYNLEPELIASVINAESAFNENAVSSAGAIGLMQIMPGTAKYISDLMGENEFKTEMLFDPDKNIDYGCYYLRYLLSRFENQKVSLSAYNAGEGNVKKWLNNETFSDDGQTLKSMPYYETMNYIEKIENSMSYYKNKFKRHKKEEKLVVNINLF